MGLIVAAIAALMVWFECKSRAYARQSQAAAERMEAAAARKEAVAAMMEARAVKACK